jgi:hypothetical protein
MTQRGEMNKLFSCLIIATILFYSCNNSVNTYKNEQGINPATIAQMDSANYTMIAWEDTLTNFGTVKEGDSVVASFRFTNSGDKALFISSAHSSCGCAVIDYSQDAVLPDKQGEVTARFQNKYRPGPVHQTVVITTNTLNKTTHVLSFFGQVADSTGH